MVARLVRILITPKVFASNTRLGRGLISVSQSTEGSRAACGTTLPDPTLKHPKDRNKFFSRLARNGKTLAIGTELKTCDTY